MDIFPSHEYWLDLGLDPTKAVSGRPGPKRFAALSGWVHDDFRIASSLTGEIPHLPRAKGSLLTGLLITRAPKAVRLLEMLSRYSQTVRRGALKSVAREFGFNAPLPRSKRLTLLLFEKEPGNLKRVQYQSLASSGRASYPFLAAGRIGRRGLNSTAFKAKLSLKLQELLGCDEGKRAEVDYIDSKRGDEAVVFSVRYEVKSKRMEEWSGPHTDTPVKRALLRVLPRYGMLEVVTPRGKSAPRLASALSAAVWGNENGFRSISEEDLSSTVDVPAANHSAVKLLSTVLRSVEAENIGMDGSPTVELNASDLNPTLTQFKDWGIDFRGKVSNWAVWIRYRSGDLSSETVVKRTRTKNRVQFFPEPPLEVKVEIYRRLRNGITDFNLT